MQQLRARSESGRDIDFQFVTSPHVGELNASETMSAYRRASRYWTIYFSPTSANPIVWTLLSEKDYDWWYAKVTELEGSEAHYPWNPTTNIFGHCGLSAEAFCGYGNFKTAPNGRKTLFQYNVIGTRYSRLPDPNVVAHESVHFYQFANSNGLPADVPCWYVEGQATLYGNVFSSVPRELDIRRVQASITDAKSKTAEEWRQLLEQFRVSPSECYRDDRHYFLGSLIWEFLLLQFSEEVHHRVLVEMNSTSWAGAIERHLATTPKQLNQAIATYLESVFG